MELCSIPPAEPDQEVAVGGMAARLAAPLKGSCGTLECYSTLAENHCFTETLCSYEIGNLWCLMKLLSHDLSASMLLRLLGINHLGRYSPPPGHKHYVLLNENLNEHLNSAETHGAIREFLVWRITTKSPFECLQVQQTKKKDEDSLQKCGLDLFLI